MTESLRRNLVQLKNELDLLPEAKEPPSTTLQIIRNNQQEQDWQRLLFHYLSPNEAHGLDHALLEQLLSQFQKRDDLDFTFSRFDLGGAQVQQEVMIPNGRRPDAVIWVPEEWFICWELKITASEREDQTQDYVDAESFSSIGLEKGDVPDANHHYVYLAPADESSPEAEEFVSVSWEWIAEEIQTFLARSHGEYPARTTAQLETLLGTIQSELTMTEYQENQQEKAKLYFEYYDEIREAEDAFENEWESFASNWGTRLVDHMDIGDPVTFSALRDSDVAIDVEVTDGDTERWVFWQGHSDYGGLFKKGWWLHRDDFSPIYRQAEDKNDARMTLYHRLEKNRERAIRDSTLELKLTHGSGIGDEFMYAFRDTLNEKIKENSDTIPSAVSVAGSRAGPLTATYDIPVGEYQDFFEAYVTTLEKAFHDLVINNRGLIAIIDDSFQESLDVFE